MSAARALSLALALPAPGVQADCLWRWTKPQILSQPGTDAGAWPGYAGVGVDASGKALVVWSQVDADGATERIMASHRPPLGNWDAPVEVASKYDPVHTNSELDLAVGPLGHALLTWNWSSNWDPTRVLVRSFDPSAGWSAPVEIQSADEVNTQPASVGVNSKGQGVAAWQSGNTLIHVRLFDPVQGWSAMRFAHIPAGSDRDYDHTPRRPSVAIGDDGRAVVAWSGGDSTWAMRYSPATGWAAAERLAGEGWVDSRRPPGLSVTPSGHVFVAWAQAKHYGDAMHVMLAHHVPGQGWQPVDRLNHLGDESREPDVSANAAGAAAVAWLADAVPQGLVGAAYRPGQGPAAPIRFTDDPLGNRASFDAPIVHLSDQGMVTAITAHLVASDRFEMQAYTGRLGGTHVKLTELPGTGRLVDAAGNASGVMVVAGAGRESVWLDDFRVRVRERDCAASAR